MTRANDSLDIMVPQRFYVHGEHSRGDRHVYASRTRFIDRDMLPLFQSVSSPVVKPEDQARQEAVKSVRIDMAARLRSMWS